MTTKDETNDETMGPLRTALHQARAVWAAAADAEIDGRILHEVTAEEHQVLLDAEAKAEEAVDAAEHALGESDEPRAFEIRTDGFWETRVVRPSEIAEFVRDYLKGGEYGDLTETIWVEGRYSDTEGLPEIADSVTISIDPKAPRCSDAAGHDWEDDGGPWGHGAGAIYHERCTHCGLVKVTDTWATNPVNGVQGLTSVGYRRDDE